MMMGKINTWERKMKKINYHECYDNDDDDDHDVGNIDGDDDDNAHCPGKWRNGKK